MSEWSGLSSAEATQRLQQYGPNALPPPRYRLLKLILRQFSGIFNILLLAAAAISFLLGESTDGWFILLFVFLGVTLDVFQEHKSNAAADKLKSYLLHTATVCRDGHDREIPTSEIVPGDILKLESGDIVPADAVVRASRNLMADETTFTGESIPVEKHALESGSAGETEADKCLLLQGVVIVRGNALAEVTATGTRTRLAHIVATASSVDAESELIKGIDRISKFILKATLFTLGLVIAANILIEGQGTDIPQLLIFAIALAVSVIPEALPLVLTFSLSHGALQFARNDVIVKRLSSVQDLGSINLLCTDKTGTITENRLVHIDDYQPADTEFHPLVLARLASLHLQASVPEPFDRAIAEALSPQQHNEVNQFTLIEAEAFEPALRSNGAVVERGDGLKLHIRRGSPEYFAEQGLCSRQQERDWQLDKEKQGYRVLGVSYDEGQGPRFGGFVAFVDRLKSTTVETIEAAEDLNVNLCIITGDALLVAEAVGREAHLVSDSAQVITASDFLSLPPDEQLQRLDSIRVFARTTPEQKLELIRLLKTKYTVGYLGEGINDAPALKAAHVSMVVQSASDVARETADIILLQQDLRVIVQGIRLGRETHANIIKYIRATLVSNFGNFYSVAIASLLISFLPMLPKQLLLLNLLSDFPMIAIAFDRVGDDEIAQPQHYDYKSLYITFITLGLVSTIFDFIYFALFYRISPAVLQTNWFIGSVITELFLMWSLRSMLPLGKAGWPAPIIMILTGVAVVLAVVLPILPASAVFFGFHPPSRGHLVIVVGVALLYLLATELAKRPLARFLSRT